MRERRTERDRRDLYDRVGRRRAVVRERLLRRFDSVFLPRLSENASNERDRRRMYERVGRASDVVCRRVLRLGKRRNVQATRRHDNFELDGYRPCRL